MDKIRLAIIIDNKMYEYRGLSCKYCEFRGDCNDLCESLGVCGSFQFVGNVRKVKLESNE